MVCTSLICTRDQPSSRSWLKLAPPFKGSLVPGGGRATRWADSDARCAMPQWQVRDEVVLNAPADSAKLLRSEWCSRIGWHFPACYICTRIRSGILRSSPGSALGLPWTNPEAHISRFRDRNDISRWSAVSFHFTVDESSVLPV
ncbi:hypothetical protein PAXRUDRAFT_828344 [Paxillus rubicundulus Ve08.2h10]|uniref:Uncharacterized protein n=1 Tax=Paxillus rubicundulus Ve08.2h10 TaxID=930991 RepID=A0A0D0E1E6_9AGAM|nr:hypothetical protein PAXRUDRAFT_828344 [Paxillus rubicundulus Ve08.2h10]